MSAQVNTYDRHKAYDLHPDRWLRCEPCGQDGYDRLLQLEVDPARPVRSWAQRYVCRDCYRAGR